MELSQQLFAHFWIFREKIKGPGECIGSRSMSGSEKCHDVITHLRIGKLIPPSLLCKQHGKHIAHITSLSSALRNQIVNQVIDFALGRQALSICCKRPVNPDVE